MKSYTKTSLAMFLTVLMVSHVASAATSFWNGPSGLSGTSQTVSDAFEVPVMQQSSMHGYTLTRAVTSKMDMEFHGQVKMSRGISHQANSQTLWSVNSRERCH